MSRNTRRQWIERNRRQATRHPGSKSGYHQGGIGGTPAQRKAARRWISTRVRSMYVRNRAVERDA